MLNLQKKRENIEFVFEENREKENVTHRRFLSLSSSLTHTQTHIQTLQTVRIFLDALKKFSCRLMADSATP